MVCTYIKSTSAVISGWCLVHTYWTFQQNWIHVARLFLFFTNSTFFFPDPKILLEKIALGAFIAVRVVKEAKFLGLIFYTKLTFKNHVQYSKTSCQKALCILWIVGHTDWGTNHIVMQCLYCALIRSKLDYRSIVYGSAHQLVLKQLDPIYHQGMHIMLGAFHTSPAQSLYVEAYELSLASQCLKLYKLCP